MKQYIVHAFTSRVFSGNPAAVCLPEIWPDDALMRSIAAENRLSETAFAVREGNVWRLRWFTPAGEIDLCGHATLAAASVLLADLSGPAGVVFETISGRLTVRRLGRRLEMDLPSCPLAPVPATEAMAAALGCRPAEAYRGRDLVCVLPDAASVKGLKPDPERLKALDGLLVHATAAGRDGFDCVTRSFGPKLGIDEDPVCGSGHCHVAPLWMDRLGKDRLTALQASDRGGVLYCRMQNGRVLLSGETALYSTGEILPARIRPARKEDLPDLAAIESACFPAAEAATAADLAARLRAFPEGFLVLEADGRPAAFIDGMRSGEADLLDGMYSDPSLHDPSGRWQMIFGLNTLPAYRRRGFGGRLIEALAETARASGCDGMVLTCKECMIPYYRRFGFVNEGISSSVHGGAVWYQMRRVFT